MAHFTPVHYAAADSVAAAAGVPAEDLKIDAPPRPELGDLAIGCFAIANQRGVKPAQLANQLAAAIAPNRFIAGATAHGPFINLRLDRPAVFRWLTEAALAQRLIPTVGTSKTICIDFSSPNISKHLAYHHIRGTTLGHALCRINRALGYRVVGINFLGDWGTTHGMLLAAWSMWGPVEPLDVAALNALYVRFTAAAKQDPQLEQSGRAWFKRLEDGDPQARALWQRFRDVSWAEFARVYDILGITFDEVRGESAYEGDLDGVIARLTAKGLVSTSEGAQVVELEGEDTPVLLRKQDGATLYATRDIAAAEYRWNSYQFARSLYVVGREQSLHFRQLFKLLARAGAEWAERCEHVAYGLVRVDGKKAGTRLGNVVLMNEVFDIMQDEVRPRIAAANPAMVAHQVDRTARDVGIGAVVFANLAAQRQKDIDFDIESATRTDGDSGPYLQYSHARCASIERRAEQPIASDQLASIDFARLTTDAEWAVARRLLAFPDAVVRASEGNEPHIICHYLLELAGDFSRWYTAGNGDPALRVLCDDRELRRARLALVGAVRAALAQGLDVLGIAAPDQM